jgi:hypothetical protein
MEEKKEVIHQENYIGIVREGLRKLGADDKLQVNCINSIRVEVHPPADRTPMPEGAFDFSSFFDSLEEPRLKNLICLACQMAKNGRSMEQTARYVGESPTTVRNILCSGNAVVLASTNLVRGLIKGEGK